MGVEAVVGFVSAVVFTFELVFVLIKVMFSVGNFLENS